jgi:hypothetical protein
VVKYLCVSWVQQQLPRCLHLPVCQQQAQGSSWVVPGLLQQGQVCLAAVQEHRIRHTQAGQLHHHLLIQEGSLQA